MNENLCGFLRRFSIPFPFSICAETNREKIQGSLEKRDGHACMLSKSGSHIIPKELQMLRVLRCV